MRSTVNCQLSTVNCQLNATATSRNPRRLTQTTRQRQLSSPVPSRRHRNTIQKVTGVAKYFFQDILL